MREGLKGVRPHKEGGRLGVRGFVIRKDAWGKRHRAQAAVKELLSYERGDSSRVSELSERWPGEARDTSLEQLSQADIFRVELITARGNATRRMSLARQCHTDTTPRLPPKLPLQPEIAISGLGLPRLPLFPIIRRIEMSRLLHSSVRVERDNLFAR